MWRNRTDLSPDTWFNAEVDYISDRNFREQFDESGWDRDKDSETLLNLNHQFGNGQFQALVKGRVNDFSDQTEWLPKFDLFNLGEPLFGELSPVRGREKELHVTAVPAPRAECR